MVDELISRQAAYEALQRHERSKGHNYLMFIDVVAECEEIILDVPPAEPQWIPVTERLPEHFGRYLVTIVPDAGELWTKVDFAMFSDLMGIIKEPIFWNGSVGKVDFENVTKNVTAWMPMPTPWKGESDG
ncbi:MAG: DUF551 domain-containing protein [Lachnospiraceae bacterium]|nr:DUF551 domain-containing protein [Lachnospiraceae bacterium]